MKLHIPKSGDILTISIHRHRYLIIIGRLVISSVSGIYLRPKVTKLFPKYFPYPSHDYDKFLKLYKEANQS